MTGNTKVASELTSNMDRAAYDLVDAALQFRSPCKSASGQIEAYNTTAEQMMAAGLWQDWCKERDLSLIHKAEDYFGTSAAVYRAKIECVKYAQRAMLPGGKAWAEQQAVELAKNLPGQWEARVDEQRGEWWYRAILKTPDSLSVEICPTYDKQGKLEHTIYVRTGPHYVTLSEPTAQPLLAKALEKLGDQIKAAQQDHALFRSAITR